MTIPRYLLFALPGPGDAYLEEAARAAMMPEALVAPRSGDFSGVALRRISPTEALMSGTLARLGIEMILIAGWEERIPLSVYQALPHGAWNIHPSLLPAYRGHNPFFHVLLNRETRTGITVHRLTDELDAGPILLQREIAIAAEETLSSLWRRLNRLGAEVGVEAIGMISRGETRTVEQPEGDHPRAPRVDPRDLLLDSKRTVEEALALIRAANPFYGAAWAIAGETIKVFEARASAVARGDESESLIIPLADGAIEATVIEVEGLGYLSGAAWQARRRARAASSTE